MKQLSEMVRDIKVGSGLWARIYCLCGGKVHARGLPESKLIRFDLAGGASGMWLDECDRPVPDPHFGCFIWEPYVEADLWSVILTKETIKPGMLVTAIRWHRPGGYKDVSYLGDAMYVEQVQEKNVLIRFLEKRSIPERRLNLDLVDLTRYKMDMLTTTEYWEFQRLLVAAQAWSAQG